MEIINHTVEKIEDPFGILSGERYEIFLQVTVPEDDDLYSRYGLTIKVLWIHDKENSKMSHYIIRENVTEKVLEFELEEEEIQSIEKYCQSLIKEMVVKEEENNEN